MELKKEWAKVLECLVVLGVIVILVAAQKAAPVAAVAAVEVRVLEGKSNKWKSR